LPFMPPLAHASSLVHAFDTPVPVLVWLHMMRYGSVPVDP
jgi:hypothetical protein